METKLITLAELLLRGYPPPVLATAIEKHGLDGWDGYGRWGLFKKTDAATQLALDDLQRVHYEMVKSGATDITDDDNQPAPPKKSWHAAVGGASFPKPIHHLGWLSNKLPDLEKVKSSLAKQPVFVPMNGPEIRTETANAIIGGLLHLLTAEIENSGIRTTLVQEDVIRALLDSVGGYDGVSESTLRTRFAAANRLLSRVVP